MEAAANVGAAGGQVNAPRWLKAGEVNSPTWLTAGSVSDRPLVPAQEVSSNGEFVVHTKHTCDKCFQLPIIGKRYKSSTHPNFDLCARCFDVYSGPEIGLTEAKALARDQKHSRDFVLKLKIGNKGDVQVRRIKVADIWGKSISHLSFDKMISIASGFALHENKVDDASGLDAFIAKAKVTYIDEDGDEITMTSNKELEDAFLQVLKKFPLRKPFIITVTVPNDQLGNGCVTAGNATGMPKRIHLRKVEPKKKAFSVSMDKPPVMGFKSKTTLRVTPLKFEKDFFVHARHTCDGCSRTPIIGSRYHATKIPDFDLCETCFGKYEGEDLDFKPEIQDRDRRMQQRWLKKQLSHSSKMSSNIAGAWNASNGDLATFLKKIQESGGNIESATVYACPRAKAAPTSELKNSVELSTAEKAPEDAADPPKEVQESVKVEAAASKCPPTATKPDTPTVEKEPGSPTPSHDESFLSDADGSGSIAEAIGRTLDVCVSAIEDAMMDELENVYDAAGSDKAKPQKSSESKTSLDDDVTKNDQNKEEKTAAVAADAFSVASSMVSSMSDILKKMDEANKADEASQAVLSQSNGADDAVASASVASVVTGATILMSEDGIEKKKGVEMPKVEDTSDGEDEWSVIDDDRMQIKHDEDIASALFNLDESLVSDKSVSSVEPLSPIVLAKWDTELHQLHELGFLDDRRNVDALGHLEASHVGVDSTEKVTVNAAVEHLLGERA
eukprot:CAMPEP_0172310186 /NCGR_PEP_ID=MMETSP1058-20130122/11337_1 /TAXON_ID=83371 /ORGANISM="Detonula confervacea, Strain CCMP 353" /LENGTH=728 /DNA_ID=CAMNT_0013022955 /DNA_START=162 /DNA_END=2348 /DNA_ORIENTATION=-